MAEPADINVDELRRRARRRLVGAVVLALGVAVVVPMLLETEQKPLGEDVSVKIPPIDDSKFVNRLSENRASDGAGAAEKTTSPPKEDVAKQAPAAPSTTSAAGAERTSKYDTRIPDAPVSGAASATPAAPAAPASADNAAPATAAKAPEVSSAWPSTQPAADAPKSATAPASVTAAGKPASSIANKAAAGASHEGFAVQLAAFADDKGANALAGRLKKSGYTAYTEPLKTSKGTLWRVRVGPYSSRDAAVVARDKLKIEGHSGIVAAVK
jgi:DedD protein